MELFIIASILVLVFILLIKPLSEIMIWFITDIIIPCFRFILNYVLLYMVKVFKDILQNHFAILKNMTTSRAIIFPTLEDQRKDRDKAMNRK